MNITKKMDINVTDMDTLMDITEKIDIDLSKIAENGSSKLSNCTVNITSDDIAMQTMDMVFIEILQPLLVVFGILGNTINVIVLTRRSMYSSTNCYLTALAIYDMLYLMIVPTLTLDKTSTFRDQLGIPYYQYTAYARPISDVFSNSAVWLTVVFTVERYIAVSHPMRGHVLCTPQRARWVILVTCTLVFMLLIPEFFEYKAMTDECAKPSLGTTDFGTTPSYSMGYNWGVVVLLFTVVPLVLVSIFNTFLVNSVWRASQMRRYLSNTNSHEERRNKDQQRITLMLIAVVIVFFCLHMPNAVTLMYISYRLTIEQSDWPADKSERYQVMKVYNCVNFLALINSTINFVLYSSLSTKYRRTFKKVFLPCCIDPGSYQFSMNSLRKTTVRRGAIKDKSTQNALLVYRSTNRKQASRKNAGQNNILKNGHVSKIIDSDSSTPESIEFLSSV